MSERVRADRDGVAAGQDIAESSIVSGNDNSTSRADVHIALDRVADMSQRELDQVAALLFRGGRCTAG